MADTVEPVYYTPTDMRTASRMLTFLADTYEDRNQVLPKESVQILVESIIHMVAAVNAGIFKPTE